MLSQSMKVAFLIGLHLVSATPVYKRSVLTDLDTVYSDVQALDASIQGWDGQLLTALNILGSVQTVETDIQTATTDTQNSAAFSSAESSSITAETESLSTEIVTTLNNLVSQKSEIAAVGITSEVETSLQSLQSLSNGLISALEAKVDSSDLPTATSVAATIQSAFATAVAAFA